MHQWDRAESRDICLETLSLFRSVLTPKLCISASSKNCAPVFFFFRHWKIRRKQELTQVMLRTKTYRAKRHSMGAIWSSRYAIGIADNRTICILKKLTQSRWKWIKSGKGKRRSNGGQSVKPYMEPFDQHPI